MACGLGGYPGTNLYDGTGNPWAGHNRVMLPFKGALKIRMASPLVKRGAVLETGSADKNHVKPNYFDIGTGYA